METPLLSLRIKQEDRALQTAIASERWSEAIRRCNYLIRNTTATLGENHPSTESYRRTLATLIQKQRANPKWWDFYFGRIEIAVTDEQPIPPNIARFAIWRYRRRSLIGIGLLIACVAYPLSIGPSAALVTAGVISHESVAAAYRPILLVNNRLPVVMRDSLSRYVQACAGTQTVRMIAFKHFLWEVEQGILTVNVPMPTRCITFNQDDTDDDQPADAMRPDNIE